MENNERALGWELIRRSRAWCVEFGLPKEWLESLLKESTDWEFSIKLASIAEDAVKEALAKHIRPEPLAQIAIKQTAKDRIELLLKLNLIEKSEANGLRAIAAIRNGYAHTVRNISQPINTFLNRDSDAGRALFNQLADSYQPSPGDTPVEKGWYAANQPRLALWMALLCALSKLYRVPVVT